MLDDVAAGLWGARCCSWARASAGSRPPGPTVIGPPGPTVGTPGPTVIAGRPGPTVIGDDGHPDRWFFRTPGPT